MGNQCRYAATIGRCLQMRVAIEIFAFQRDKERALIRPAGTFPRLRRKGGRTRQRAGIGGHGIYPAISTLQACLLYTSRCV